MYGKAAKMLHSRNIEPTFRHLIQVLLLVWFERPIGLFFSCSKRSGHAPRYSGSDHG